MALFDPPYESASAVVAAPAAAIFDLLADPRRHADIDGSGTVRGSVVGGVVGPDRLSEGAEFGMRMRLLVPYTITNRVVEFEPDRRIGWRHIGRHVWRYELEPVDERHTRVTESWDCAGYPRPARLVLRLLGFPARNRRGITATLARLQQHFSR